MRQDQPPRLAENIDVVRFYLYEAFPDRQIEVILAPEPERRQDRVFRVFGQGNACFLNVPYEFLCAYDAMAVTDYLRRWNVAQLLREAEPNLVTLVKDQPPIRAD